MIVEENEKITYKAFQTPKDAVEWIEKNKKYIDIINITSYNKVWYKCELKKI